MTSFSVSTELIKYYTKIWDKFKKHVLIPLYSRSNIPNMTSFFYFNGVNKQYYTKIWDKFVKHVLIPLYSRSNIPNMTSFFNFNGVNKQYYTKIWDKFKKQVLIPLYSRSNIPNMTSFSVSTELINNIIPKFGISLGSMY